MDLNKQKVDRINFLCAESGGLPFQFPLYKCRQGQVNGNIQLAGSKYSKRHPANGRSEIELPSAKCRGIHCAAGALGSVLSNYDGRYICCIPEQSSCDSGEMTHLYLFSPFSSVRLLIPRQEWCSSSIDPKNGLWIEVTRSHYNAREESTRRSRKNIRALCISCIKILGKTLPVVLDTISRFNCRCYRLGQCNLSFRILTSATRKNIKNHRN